MYIKSGMHCNLTQHFTSSICLYTWSYRYRLDHGKCPSQTGLQLQNLNSVKLKPIPQLPTSSGSFNNGEKIGVLGLKGPFSLSSYPGSVLLGPWTNDYSCLGYRVCTKPTEINIWPRKLGVDISCKPHMCTLRNGSNSVYWLALNKG